MNLFNRSRSCYVIALRLTTDSPSGTVISRWGLESPWPDHVVDWGYDPEDIISKKYWDGYRSLLNSRLMKVLNERRLIRRGYPVEGIVCGRSFQPIGESFHGVVPAKLRFTDDIGNTVRLRIDLDLYGLSKASAHRSHGRSGGKPVPCEAEVDREWVFDRRVEAGTKYFTC